MTIHSLRAGTERPARRWEPLARLARLPVLGLPLIAAWDWGWIAHPQGEAVARLRDGRILRCRLEDRTQRTMYLGLFEPRESRLVRRLLRQGDQVIDIGAHIGWFTTICARQVGPTGQVIAVEPYPSNMALLHENLALNHCSNVRLVEQPLGRSHGEELRLAQAGDSGGVTAIGWGKVDPVVVSTATLDEIGEGLGRIALIKLDVEGFEANVLRGGPATLSRTDRVLIEINSPSLARAGSSRRDVLALLADAGLDRVTKVGPGLLHGAWGDVPDNLLVTRSNTPSR